MMKHLPLLACASLIFFACAQTKETTWKTLVLPEGMTVDYPSDWHTDYNQMGSIAVIYAGEEPDSNSFTIFFSNPIDDTEKMKHEALTRMPDDASCKDGTTDTIGSNTVFRLTCHDQQFGDTEWFIFQSSSTMFLIPLLQRHPDLTILTAMLRSIRIEG